VTERLYYHDSYATEFRAGIVDASPDRRRIYLDRTAFYPTSGGQPHDLGTINDIEIVEVLDEDDGRIAHLLSEPVEGSEVEGRVDWQRRFDHMQQHTGQHLLSAVLIELFDAQTVSFHLGVESSTIDIARPSLEPEEIRRALERANQIVFENRPVSVSFRHSSEDLGLRKATEREGMVRIVAIDKLDRSACGGTHVRATGEIGSILIRRLEKVRGNVRVEFLCGMRAVKRAHADYEALAGIARSFSATLDEAPGLVTAQIGKLQESEKSRGKLAIELAQAKGRQLHADTLPGADGICRVRRTSASSSDELRAEAQAFVSGGKAVFLALIDDPPALLLAASKDSGVNAGQLVKEAVSRVGGRGGGNPGMGQGSVPNRASLDSIAAELALAGTSSPSQTSNV
jgi:alanyl-tRNA synthetase